MRPFRFGILTSSLPINGWIEWLRHIEGLGYSAIHWPDHFGPQIDNVVAMAAAAGVTEKLRLGSLVYCVDYWHPVVYAKAAASIHALLGGRHEFGIGAGWMEDDYSQAGIPFDKPSVRIERLDEALQIIKACGPKSAPTLGEITIRSGASNAPLSCRRVNTPAFMWGEAVAGYCLSPVDTPTSSASCLPSEEGASTQAAYEMAA